MSLYWPPACAQAGSSVFPLEESRETTGGRVARSEKKKYTVIKLKGKKEYKMDEKDIRWQQDRRDLALVHTHLDIFKSIFFGSLVTPPPQYWKWFNNNNNSNGAAQSGSRMYQLT